MFSARNRNSTKVISVADFPRSKETSSNVSFSIDTQRQSREGDTRVRISENSSHPIHNDSERSSFRNFDSQDGLEGNNSRSEAFSFSRSKTSLSQYSLPSAENLVLRDLLSDVNVACVPNEARVVTLKKLLKEFNEHPLPDYDFELLHGALNIIYQKLAVALCTNPTDEELRLSCNVIEILHQASEIPIESAFNDIGLESIPLLISVLQMPFLDNYHTDDGRSRRRPVLNHGLNIITNENEATVQIQSGRRASEPLKDAIQSVCITLLCYSSVESGRALMAQIPGLLLSLLWVLDKFHSMPVAARCAAIIVISNLSSLRENRHIILKTPRLLTEIKRLTANDEHDLIRSNAKIAIQNLENSPLNSYQSSPLMSEDRRAAMNHETFRSIMFSNTRLGGISKESSISSINRVSPLPPMVGNSNRINEIPLQQSVVSSTFSLSHSNFDEMKQNSILPSTGDTDNVPSHSLVNNNYGNQREASPQWSHFSHRLAPFSGTQRQLSHPIHTGGSEMFQAPPSFHALNLDRENPTAQTPSLSPQYSGGGKGILHEDLSHNIPACRDEEQSLLYSCNQVHSSQTLHPSGTSLHTNNYNQSLSSHQSAYHLKNTQSTEQIPLYPGNEGRLPQTLYPYGVSFQAHDDNLGANQGVIVEQSKDLIGSNKTAEKIPLYSGNQGRSYGMMFPGGTSFRYGDSNQGVTPQHPTFPVNTIQNKQIPAHPTNEYQPSRMLSFGTSFRSPNQVVASSQPMFNLDQRPLHNMSSQHTFSAETSEFNAKLSSPRFNQDAQHQNHTEVKAPQHSTFPNNQRSLYPNPSMRSVLYSSPGEQKMEPRTEQSKRF